MSSDYYYQSKSSYNYGCKATIGCVASDCKSDTLETL